MLEIFLPIQINDYYLISKKILSISISGYYIVITLVKTTGKKRIILASKEQLVAKDEALAYELQIGSALEKLVQGLTFDIVKIIVPSFQAIFKSLRLPFLDLEKLKMVVPFEIAQSLPFSLQEGSIDLIQTKIFPETKESQIIVAIIRQETVVLYREICKNAGIDLSIISLDAFEIASLYPLQIEKAESNSAIIHFDKESATVMLFEHDALVGIRVILHETNEPSLDINHKSNEEQSPEKKQLDSESESTTAETDENPPKEPIVKKTAKQIAAAKKHQLSSEKSYGDYIIDHVAETLDALKQQANMADDIKKIWVAGTTESVLHDLAQALEKSLKITTVLFPCLPLKEIVVEKSNNDERACSPSHLVSFAGALDLKNMKTFNLAHEEHIAAYKSILTKQLFATFIVICTFLISICIWDYIRLARIVKTGNELEKQTVQFIKNNFELSGKNITTIERAQKEAEASVSQLEDLWLSVSGSRRYHALMHLNTLSQYLEKDIKGLKIEEVTFKAASINHEESMTIKGLVADFINLQKLESQLRDTQLFVSIPQSQDTHFNYNLTLQKHGDIS